MNKTELAVHLQEEFNLDSQAEAMSMVNFVFDKIHDTLAEGEEVAVAGFGKFVVNERKARAGRNPATGETMQIPASNVVKFRVSKGLKDGVNK